MYHRDEFDKYILASHAEEQIFLETITSRFNDFLETVRDLDNNQDALKKLEDWSRSTEQEVIVIFRSWYEDEVMGKKIPRSVIIPKPRQDRIYRYLTKRFKKRSCEVCGDRRVLNIAHIIPRCDGGPDEEWNLMRLCANHHYLFDEHKLTEKEWSKIDWKSKDKRVLEYVESHQLRCQTDTWKNQK